MRKPPALRLGDTVAVVSPSSPVSREKLEAGLSMLAQRGYEVRFGQFAFAQSGFIAGDDSQRAADLQDAWFDPAIAGIVCSRGGYGMGRLLPYLDLDRMAAHPKLLVGFSDLTALHLALNKRGLATLHGPMLLSFVRERAPWVVAMWFEAMEGAARITLPSEAPRSEALTPGVGEGIVTGGCLCLLCDSLATPNQVETSNRIVLIEDVDEPPHRVDAMLTHLLNAGLLRDAAGIVVGEFTGSNEKVDEGIGGAPWKEIVKERLGGLGVPTVVGFPFGHQLHMASLPLGIRARLDAARGELTYLELGVEPR
jgi:muramoyltetrapeptide carboxypeptidase